MIQSNVEYNDEKNLSICSENSTLTLYIPHCTYCTCGTFSNIAIVNGCSVWSHQCHSNKQLFKKNMYLQSEHFDSLQEEVVWACWVHITALMRQEYLQQIKWMKASNESDPQQNTSTTFNFRLNGQLLQNYCLLAGTWMWIISRKDYTNNTTKNAAFVSKMFYCPKNLYST